MDQKQKIVMETSEEAQPQIYLKVICVGKVHEGKGCVVMER